MPVFSRQPCYQSLSLSNSLCRSPSECVVSSTPLYVWWSVIPNLVAINYSWGEMFFKLSADPHQGWSFHPQSQESEQRFVLLWFTAAAAFIKQLVSIRLNHWTASLKSYYVTTTCQFFCAFLLGLYRFLMSSSRGELSRNKHTGLSLPDCDGQQDSAFGLVVTPIVRLTLNTTSALAHMGQDHHPPTL